MNEFKGFPVRMRFTQIPNIVFSSLLPQISDITELKVLLHIFELIYPKKGRLRFVSHSELLGHPGLALDLNDRPRERLSKALESLTKRGVILHLSVKQGENTEDIYFLNTEANKAAVSRIQAGEIVLNDLKPVVTTPPEIIETADVFTLYEQNIGMLTPLIAEELKEAGKHYPESWLKDAIKEAAALNKRNWRYIARILENWSTEGKDNGTYRGHLKKISDPDKYIRGKYGHMVQR
jgi:DNA replication protein